MNPERVVLAEDLILYTVPGAAEYLGVSRKVVERLVRTKLPSVNHGGRRLILQEQLDTLRERRAQAGSRTGPRPTRFRPPPRDLLVAPKRGE